MLFKFMAGPPTLHNMLKRCGLLLAAGCALAVAAQVALPSAAAAYPFRRTLSRGDYGRDVRALEVRVAGWYWATISTSSWWIVASGQGRGARSAPSSASTA